MRKLDVLSRTLASLRQAIENRGTPEEVRAHYPNVDQGLLTSAALTTT